jgi:hypothetical protein
LAEQGLDYEEVLHQRANDMRLMKELNLTLLDWAGRRENERTTPPQR